MAHARKEVWLDPEISVLTSIKYQQKHPLSIGNSHSNNNLISTNNDHTIYVPTKWFSK